MKTPRFTQVLFCAALLALVPGCNKSEQSTSTPPPEVKKTPDAPAAAADVNAEAAKAAAALKATADSAVTAAQAQATNLQADTQKAAADAQVQPDQLTAKNQGLLDSVKQMLADKKPADALKILNDLAASKLTPAQQATFDNLKQQAQAMLQNMATSKAGDAVGGLLNKKP